MYKGRALSGVWFSGKGLLNKYGAALFALLSFFVEGPSAIDTASAIIPHSSFGQILVFKKTSSLRARAGAAIIDEGD